MTSDEFEKIINYQWNRCLAVLSYKADEYATEDRLHNFKVAAEIQGCTPLQALAGFMAKHTVSLYDMMRENNAPLSQWDEKITDHLNYLFILRAMLEENSPSKVDLSVLKEDARHP